MLEKESPYRKRKVRIIKEDPAAHASPCSAGATTACLAGGRFASRRGRVPAHPPGDPMAGAQGYWRLGALPRRSPCRVRYNTFTAWFHNDAGGCCSSLFSPALVQCEANSGGRSRSQRAVLATSIRCLFSLHQLRRLTWPQRRCVTQRLNASTVPPNTRLLR